MEYFELNDIKCKCGNNKFFFKHNKMHIGVYCSKCGCWVKWASKNEKNIAEQFFSQFNK